VIVAEGIGVGGGRDLGESTMMVVVLCMCVVDEEGKERE